MGNIGTLGHITSPARGKIYGLSEYRGRTGEMKASVLSICNSTDKLSI